jgi:hypothetical protein
VNRLAPQLKAVLIAARPTLRATRKGLPAIERIAKAIIPLADALDPAGQDLVPIVSLAALYKNEIAAAFADDAAATQFSLPQIGGRTPLHTLRAMPIVTNELLLGYPQRPGTDRFNPYLAPGGQAKLVTGGLESFSCAHTGNPTPIPATGTGVPSCKTQQPWEFQGVKRSYPHAERAK